MTETPIELPRDPQGGVTLCHLCRNWRAVEHVHDVNGTPTCETCDPSLRAPEPGEAKRASRERRPAKKAAPRTRKSGGSR